MRRLLTPLAVLGLCFGLGGCATSDDELDGPHPLDLEEPDDGKADGAYSSFDPNRVVSDQAFFDTQTFSAARLQSFFANTPYGRSFLADEIIDGESAAVKFHRVAVQAGINPMVLVVTLQKESSIVSRTTRPSRSKLDYAFGCGCPDNQACMSQFKGFGKQIECAAERLGTYLDEIHQNGQTVAGWAPNKTKRVLDGTTVTPYNLSTAMLYTYTPWIARGTGGNWLFWNIWRRFSSFTGYQAGASFPFNEGYIGGSCNDDNDCFYSGGYCDFDGGVGTCTLACDRVCPDRPGQFATTFCVSVGGRGACRAQCDTGLEPGDGCPASYACVPTVRHNDPSAERNVCTP